MIYDFCTTEKISYKKICTELESIGGDSKELQAALKVASEVAGNEDGSFVPCKTPTEQPTLAEASTDATRLKRHLAMIDEVEVDYDDDYACDKECVNPAKKAKSAPVQDPDEDIDDKVAVYSTPQKKASGTESQDGEGDESASSESVLEDGEIVDCDNSDDSDFVPKKLLFKQNNRCTQKQVSGETANDEDDEIEIIAVNGIKVKK